MTTIADSDGQLAKIHDEKGMMCFADRSIRGKRFWAVLSQPVEGAASDRRCRPLHPHCVLTMWVEARVSSSIELFRRGKCQELVGVPSLVFAWILQEVEVQIQVLSKYSVPRVVQVIAIA
jgi:hypothetical protein